MSKLFLPRGGKKVKTKLIYITFTASDANIDLLIIFLPLLRPLVMQTNKLLNKVFTKKKKQMQDGQTPRWFSSTVALM